MRYAAFIHKDSDSDFGVSFPDVPGCIAVGETVEAALKNAAEALAFQINGMEADGEPVPHLRSPDDILSDPVFEQDRKDAIVASVPLVRDLGSTTRINVSLDLGLLRAIDEEARDRRQSRSAFIASAVRKEIAG